MTLPMENLLNAALALPDQDRVELVEALIASLQVSPLLEATGG